MTKNENKDQGDIFPELVAKWSAHGDLDDAVANAEAAMFDAVKKNDGIPIELMVKANDIWMEWVSRTIAATMMKTVAEIEGWTPKQQQVATREMIQAFQLLKNDAYEAVITGKT